MATPPSGTVTFLFTDIENSTQLWEAYPEAMDRSLARHNTLLRQAFEAHSGVVFKVIGDAFQAAFALPDQALAAALAAQRALHAEPPSGWGETGRLRVRMGLHAGPAEWTGSDYAVSHTLNRLARVVAAAYSDQILLTAAVAELLHGEWPADVTLDDLGQHRMRGLSRPERLYQVVTLDLPATFPALKTLDAHPNNLPAQPTGFIGREPELTELHTLLTRPDVRLVTLTGPGGTGKTRLALQVAADLLQEFPDGVYFVNLAPIIDPSLVTSTIAQTLNLQEVGQHSALDLLKVALREKRILLLLDNFEQVITGAGVVAELHAACPALKSLVTSREVLHLRGEQDYPVPPLGLPPRTEDGRRKTEDGRGKREDELRTTDYATYITHYEAVRLFIQRALEIKPDFAVTN
ncbi:MAG: adenylate/guanylate cyclase domain-containing protein, partial [Anaerolineae bacterium]|nr:adenylate/guanylate cyclase domain-containing protein [Anaerolineae bacterium]